MADTSWGAVAWVEVREVGRRSHGDADEVVDGRNGVARRRRDSV